MIGVGGYISGGLNYYFGLPLVLTIPVATFGGALICTLLWLPCLPLRGIYFAVVTFMFPFLVRSIIIAGGLFRGTEGLSPIGGFPNIWLGVYHVSTLALRGRTLLFVGYLDNWVYKPGSIKLTAIDRTIKGDRLTLNKYNATCRWRTFKGPKCQYVGAATFCDRTYERCYIKNNFGGFRWLPDISERVLRVKDNAQLSPRG